MSALPSPVESETLPDDELERITGCKRPSDQIAWLKSNRWHYVTNRAGLPRVGTWYARHMLAGIRPAANNDTWTFDPSRLHS